MAVRKQVRREVEMNAGDSLHYVLGTTGVTVPTTSEGVVVVGMNEFGLTKDSPATLMAGGDPCPVVVFHRPEERIGGLVHIDGMNAEQDGGDHEPLLTRLLEAAPELAGPTLVYICYDPHPAPGLALPVDMNEGNIVEQVDLRDAYVAKVEEYLHELGIEEVVRVTEGFGKTVYLNTAEGELQILDDEDNLIPIPKPGASGARAKRVRPDVGLKGLELSQKPIGSSFVAKRGLTRVSFGLDLAGFSKGATSLARIERVESAPIRATVLEGHCFAAAVESFDDASAVLGRERDILAACMEHGPLFVDVPVDLQDLPFHNSSTFVWELVKRPIDCAFNARPPLADFLGSPVARFAALWRLLRQSGTAALGRELFETYPAASLSLLKLPARGYKGKAVYRAGTGWEAVASSSGGQQAKSMVLASTLQNLRWTATAGKTLSHDAFDAILCGVLGVVDPAGRLEKEALSEVMRAELSSRAGNRPLPAVFAPPAGYVLLRERPAGICVSWQTVSDLRGFASEIEIGPQSDSIPAHASSRGQS